MQLDGIIPWQRFAKKLVRYYQGKALYGPAPYNPVIILKMLRPSFLYDISERQTEDLVNFNLLAKCFVGRAVDEPAPDHSTLSLFKARLLENEKTTAFETAAGDHRHRQRAGCLLLVTPGPGQRACHR